MNTSKKLAIVTTHPIQYNAPWFRLLNKNESIELKVFYTWSQSKFSVSDRTFGKEIEWDIPLLNGYNYTFLENVSKDPGTHHRMGIICPNIIEKLTEFSPDVIMVFGWYLKSHFDVIKFFQNKIRLWFRGDSTLIDEMGFLRSFLRKLYLTYIYRKIDKAFYVGENNRKYFIEYGVKLSNLVFANHAIDNNRFSDNNEKSYENNAKKIRDKLGINQSDIVILFSGKLEDKKQPLFLVRAFQNANKKLKIKLKLVMVGHGPLEEDIKYETTRDDNIFILPFQNQSKMPIIYRIGDVFCLPSKGPSETWGLAVNEAMASSRSIIVSNRVGCAVDLVNEENGFVFNHDNLNELERILIDLRKDTLRQKGINSKEKISSWNFQNIVDAIIHEINKI